MESLPVYRHLHRLVFRSLLQLWVDRDSSVGIAARYGLDGSAIEFRWRWGFSPSSIRALGPTEPFIHWVPGLFTGDKAAGAWRWPPTPVHLLHLCAFIVCCREICISLLQLRLTCQAVSECTRWFKYDRDYLCVKKSQFVPVIFEPPCIYLCTVRCKEWVVIVLGVRIHKYRQPHVVAWRPCFFHFGQIHGIHIRAVESKH